jgi:hypothetical protein
MDQSQRGRPLAIDHKAASTSPTEPAFIARPEGAPVYHGFVILDDIAIEGFTLGKLTDWEAEPCETGDAFVIAPDGSRAVWFGKFRTSITSKKSGPSRQAGGACGASVFFCQ